jgi:hypothetical protein
LRTLISKALGADDNKETFKTHNDHLSNLVRDTYHLRAHAAEQRTGIAVAVAIDAAASSTHPPSIAVPVQRASHTLSTPSAVQLVIGTSTVDSVSHGIATISTATVGQRAPKPTATRLPLS